MNENEMEHTSVDDGRGSGLRCGFYIIIHKDGACDIDCGKNLVRLMLI
jgi:hypothetical protein